MSDPHPLPQSVRSPAGPALVGIGIVLVSFLALSLSLVRDLKAEVSDASVTILMLEDKRVSGPKLHRFLQDPDPEVRGRAAVAIGRIGLVRDVERLSPLLDDTDPTVRRQTAFALGEIADSIAGLPLAERLLSKSETDPETRALMVEALGKIGQGAEACRAAIGDPHPQVVAQALFAAWKIPVPGATDLVLERTRDSSAEIRWPATYCLMRFLGARASGRTPIPGGIELHEEERERIGARLLELTEDPDLRVRLQAVRGLRSFGDPAVTEAILSLLDATKDWRLLVEAIRALATPIPDDSATVLREVPIETVTPWIDSANPNVAATAIGALGTLGSDSEAHPLLEGLMSTGSARVRQLGFEAWVERMAARTDSLDEVDEAELVGWMARLTKDAPTWQVKAACAQAAERLIPERELARAPFRWAHDDPRVAKFAIERDLRQRIDRTDGGPLLGRLDPFLSELKSHTDPIIRLVTLDAVSTLYADSTSTPTEEDWKAFEELLSGARADALEREGDTDLRQTLVDIAQAHSDREAMRVMLRKAVGDPNYVVRRAACDALADLGEDPSRDATPVETRFTQEQYREILEWADREHQASLYTDNGEIVIALYSGEAPLTCWNFKDLANSGFYDRGNWHRVVPNFVLQDGCPRGDGWGGPPHQIRCEINLNRYTTGAFGMALSGKDTGGSQFFITHSDQPHLDGGYTVFGEVLKGMEIADRIAQGAPIDSIRVDR